MQTLISLSLWSQKAVARFPRQELRLFMVKIINKHFEVFLCGGGGICPLLAVLFFNLNTKRCLVIPFCCNQKFIQKQNLLQRFIKHKTFDRSFYKAFITNCDQSFNLIHRELKWHLFSSSAVKPTELSPFLIIITEEDWGQIWWTASTTFCQQKPPKWYKK